MFGLQKYLTNLYSIEWYFPHDKLVELEEDLFVDFERCDGFFKIKYVRYSYVDILTGLEDKDFELKKIGDTIKIKILKI